MGKLASGKKRYQVETGSKPKAENSEMQENPGQETVRDFLECMLTRSTIVAGDNPFAKLIQRSQILFALERELF
jgi:hypothetical protein